MLSLLQNHNQNQPGTQLQYLGDTQNQQNPKEPASPVQLSSQLQNLQLDNQQGLRN